MSAISADWVEIMEPRSQERMYVNLATGECGWTPPLGAPVRQADGNQWWELFDPHSGRFYYYNSTGRCTVWHRPQGGDIVPLSQLQAMKRSREARRSQGSQGRGADGTAPAPWLPPGRDRDGSLPPGPPEEEEAGVDRELAGGGGGRSQGDGSSVERSKDPRRDPSQRWQPPPGSKAAMLVKVNSMSRSQPGPPPPPPVSQPQLPHQEAQGTARAPGGPPSQAAAYKMAPAGKPQPPRHVRKVSNGSFCLGAAAEPGQPSPLPRRAGGVGGSCSPRPASPPYGWDGAALTPAPPLYDDPVSASACPIYDEPPVDMEVEGAHLHNGRGSQKPRLLQQPPSAPAPTSSSSSSSLSGSSRHRRGPSSSDYSPAGLECIKHMVNVDPGSSSSVARTPSPPPRGGAPGFSPGVGVAPLDKRQVWRALEACAAQRHSRQSSQASQDASPASPTSPTSPSPGPFALQQQQQPLPPATAASAATATAAGVAMGTYQDSGYSTGPSPSLRRKSRRRVVGGGLSGVTAGGGGSVGSSSELSALNERLMAEMREVVSRSNTMREGRGGREGARSPADSLRWYGGGAGGEDPRSLGRAGNYSNGAAALPAPGGVGPMEFPGRQKRTYEKVDTLEKSMASMASLSSPETPGPSQVGTLELQAQLEVHQKGTVDGHTASLGPHSHRHRQAAHDGREGGDGIATGTGRSPAPSPGAVVSSLPHSPSSPGTSYPLSYATLRPPCPDAGMADWASAHLNTHTQGLFRRRVSIANMLSWNRGSIKKPMLVTADRAARKEACEMFKLVQAYMGDRPSRLDRRHAALLVVTKCWDVPGLRDELYVQLVRQTTANAGPRSLAAGWELMAVVLAFFAPSPKFRCYLEGYIQRHTEPASDKKLSQFILEQQESKLKKNSKSRKKRKQTDEEEGLPISTYAKFCYRKLQKVAITGGKKGLRKPTLEEIDHSRRAIVTPSLFGSSLQEVMERQSELFPDRKLPWVQVQLSQYVLALGGAQTEGIFRVPGDIDEVNALKLQVDQWRIPENLSDPNVPASLMKLWYRELEEPLIPMDFYKRCVSNYDDPVAAIAVVQCLPDLNRLVLCYFIHFLQVFAQPSNVAITKMDVNNLAMVMAPNCLRCQSDDPRVIFENTRKEMSFLRMLIVHLDTSFVEGVV